MLPDVALLEIFDCYVNQAREEEGDDKRWVQIQAWRTLAHVCRKWRTTVLGSPRRLNLRLFCKETTPVKETLAVWPPLPIVIGQHNPPYKGLDNIITALEHNDRVCDIRLSVFANSELEEVFAAMQQPFPALTHLELSLWNRGDLGWEDGMPEEEPLVAPESFLGGFAPFLQHLYLQHVPFPGLPKLLLSAADLVSLCLFEIPHSGYISPEAMVCCLSTLTRLESLTLAFKSPLSRRVRETQRSHPPIRSALPALLVFQFEGVSEYLEDLVARIEAPLLDRFDIRFFHQLIFDTPQLAHFVTRTSNTEPPVEARVVFSHSDVVVSSPGPRSFSLGISCRQLDWQLSSLTEVCNSSFPKAFISTVEHLYISGAKYWQDDIEDSQWLEVLHPFMAVKYLYLSRAFAPCIALALQEIAGEVLPSLQHLFLDLHPLPPGLVQGALVKFVAARQLDVSYWDSEQGECEEPTDGSFGGTGRGLKATNSR